MHRSASFSDRERRGATTAGTGVPEAPGQGESRARSLVQGRDLTAVQGRGLTAPHVHGQPCTRGRDGLVPVGVRTDGRISM
jgi:hypothetical protein